MVTKKFAGRAYTVLWYGTVSSIIVAAVIMSLVRVLLPLADDYRGRVEQWVSARLGEPVRIETMNVRLIGASPTLIFSGVQLVEDSASGPRFGELQFGFDPIASARLLQPVLGEVVIRGASLSIERLPDGEFRVRGLPLNPPSADSVDSPVSMGGMLSSQPTVIIRESSVTWQDHRRGGSPMAFEQVEIELHNRGDRHRLDADFRLPEEFGGAVRLAVDLEGELLRPHLGKGSLFLSAEGWRPGASLRELPELGLGIVAGEADISLWANWRGEQEHSVSASVKARGLKLAGEAEAGVQGIDTLSAHGRWRRDATQWNLEVADLEMERADSRWRDAHIHASGSFDGQMLQFKANRLMLTDVAALAGLWPGLEPEQRRILTQASPSGELSAVRLSREGDRWSMQATGVDLGMAPVDRMPGFSGVDGSFVFKDGQGELELTTREAVLRIPRLFRHPMTLDRLDGRFHIDREGARWRVSSPSVRLANRDVKAELGITLDSAGEGSPFVDLRGTFRDVPARSVASYLPVGIMDPKSVKWLDGAFREGRVTEGSLLLHGRLADFPFRKKEGRFLVSFDAREVGLDYMPGWPAGRGLGGRVEFDGNRLHVRSDRGRILDTSLKDVDVVIPDLTKAVLYLRGAAQGPLPDLLTYLRQSELLEGEALDRFSAGGNSRLELTLRVPLSGRATESLSYKGGVQLRNARIEVGRTISFEKLNGQVEFDGLHFSSDGIEGRLLDQPVSVSVASQGWGEALTTEVAFRGSVSGESLSSLGDSPLLDRFTGKTGWRGVLVLPHRTMADTAFRLNSDLEGLAVSLPAPFAKEAKAREAFKAVIFPGTGRGEVLWERRLGAIFELGKTGGLRRAAVDLNGRVRELPGEDVLRVTGSLDGFSPASWKSLLGNTGEAAAGGSGATAALLPPVRIEMDQLRIVAADAAAPDPSQAKTSPPPELPPLAVRVNALTYEDMALGRVEFRGEPSAAGLAVRDFSAVGRHLRIEGSGDWKFGKGEGTELQLTFRSDDLGEAMRDLRVASLIRDGEGKAKLKLSWPGGPGDFALETLKGSLRIDVKDGRIDDFEPGAGRLLGLLSLQALHRRLLLDFSDIFGKGMRFEDIEGDIRLANGDAHTDNLRLDALPASVLTTGRTGLRSRDFDHVITVIPQVSGTLPLAGGLALGPQVGAVLLLFQQVLGERIDEGARFQYSVKGDWDKPVVERLDAPAVSSAAQVN